MSKSILVGILKLLRLPYWLMTGGLSLLMLAAFKGGNLNVSVALLTFFSMALLGSAGFAINDFFDRETDAIIKPRRPIPAGEISPNLAVGISFVLFTVALILSYFINWLCFAVVLIDAVLLILYSLYVKKKSGFFANVLVGCLTGTAFLYGEASGFGGISIASMSIYPVCFGTIGGNILRDILSMDGDSKVGYPTLPRSVGLKMSARVAVLFFLICAFSTPLPYIYHVFGEGYLICMLILSLLIIGSSAILLKTPSLDNVRRIERLITMSMILLPIALLIEAFL